MYKQLQIPKVAFASLLFDALSNRVVPSIHRKRERHSIV